MSILHEIAQNFTHSQKSLFPELKLERDRPTAYIP